MPDRDYLRLGLAFGWLAPGRLIEEQAGAHASADALDTCLVRLFQKELPIAGQITTSAGIVGEFIRAGLFGDKAAAAEQLRTEACMAEGTQSAKAVERFCLQLLEGGNLGGFFDSQHLREHIIERCLEAIVHANVFARNEVRRFDGAFKTSREYRAYTDACYAALRPALRRYAETLARDHVPRRAQRKRAVYKPLSQELLAQRVAVNL